MPSPDDSHTPSIQVIGRMFALIDALSAADQAVPLKTLAVQTGLHPSTAHRILNDLAISGMVERPSSGHYRLGIKLLTLGNVVRSKLDVRARALGALRDLHRHTKQTVVLHLCEGDRLVEWSLEPASRGMPETYSSAKPSARWLHDTDFGLALLAQRTRAQQQMYLLKVAQQTGDSENLAALLDGPIAKTVRLNPDNILDVMPRPGENWASAVVFNDTCEAIGLVSLKLQDSSPSYREALVLAADKITAAIGGIKKSGP